MNTMKLYNISKEKNSWGEIEYICDVIDEETAQAYTIRLTAKNKEQALKQLKNQGIKCPHEAYRKK